MKHKNGPQFAGDNRWLGNMNARVLTHATCGQRKFTFDGTTLDLTRQAVALKIRVGAKLKTEIGNFVLTEAKHDDRAGGFWATQTFKR